MMIRVCVLSGLVLLTASTPAWALQIIPLPETAAAQAGLARSDSKPPSTFKGESSLTIGTGTFGMESRYRNGSSFEFYGGWRDDLDYGPNFPDHSRR